MRRGVEVVEVVQIVTESVECQRQKVSSVECPGFACGYAAARKWQRQERHPNPRIPESPNRPIIESPSHRVMPVVSRRGAEIAEQ
jgi:hypothetical protein